MYQLGVFAFVLTSCLLSGATTSQPPFAPTLSPQLYRYYLTGIEVTGTRRLTRSQVIQMSGLTIGRVVEPKDVEAARTRLVETGLFATATYRYRTRRYSVVVVFDVEEAIRRTRLLFDNFVGIDDGRIQRAVGAVLPAFDGFVPEQLPLLARVARALESVAREARQPGRVTWTLVDDSAHADRHYRVRLERDSGPLLVCRLVIAGVEEPLLAELRARARRLVGNDYSKDYIANYARLNLLPVLQAGGDTRARVGGIEAEREPNDGCADGVRVTIAIARAGEH